jgi:hypothetical protein
MNKEMSKYLILSKYELFIFENSTISSNRSRTYTHTFILGNYDYNIM